MTANNPFEESSNPWSSEAASGPRFGNAYEDSGQNNNSWRMPSPSDYRHESNKIETTHNESTKVEFNPQVHEQDTSTAWEAPASSRQTPDSNAYQFSGTRYGNVDHHSGNAYSAAPVAATPPPLPETPRPSNKSNKDDNGLPPAWDDKRMHPSKWRALLRFIQLIASIGHLGFAAGASPFSQQPVPFDSKACFYYLFAVAILSIIWAFVQLFYICLRRFSSKTKMNRPMMMGIDSLLALFWGIGIIVEVAKFHCSPGDNWCNFYNVSIFWGFVAFASFITAVAWDIVGGCITHKK